MKAPVLAPEVRWRTEDETRWQTIRMPPGSAFDIPNAVRGETYTVELRNVGSNGMLSAPTVVEITIPTTNREGAAALPPVAVGNVSSRWVTGTEVTYAATDTTATISVSAGVLQIADKQISYGASSAEITDGTAEEVRTVWLYYDDPRLVGGTRTLGVTDDPVTSLAAFGRVLIVPLQITFDVAGGGGTGGGGGIGGGGGGSGGSNQQLA